MLYRHIAVAVLAFLLASPLLAAYRPGDVFLEQWEHAPGYNIRPGHRFWFYIGGPYTIGHGVPLIYKSVPFGGAGRFLIPSPDQFVFHSQRTVSTWNGVYEIYTLPGKGYTDIFTSDTDLGEIAPMRSGNFLVAERRSDRGAKLIEFNPKGKVREYAFPGILGATHIELLSDQCTLLYTLGSDDAMGNAVRRLNICTNQPQTDFATLVSGQYAGAIRELPNGNIVVANGSAIHHFTPAGSLIRSYPLPGVTHLALTLDGTALWASGVHLDKTFMLRFDLAAPFAEPQSIRMGNPEMQTIMVPIEVTELVVVGEWRASRAQPARTRGRAVRR